MPNELTTKVKVEEGGQKCKALETFLKGINCLCSSRFFIAFVILGEICLRVCDEHCLVMTVKARPV